MNNALAAGASALALPSRKHESERWGRWVNNACLAHAINTGRYSAEDLRGLAHAAKGFPAFQPFVLCDCGQEREVDPGDAILIPAGAGHQIRALEPLRFLCCCAPPYAHEDTCF